MPEVWAIDGVEVPASIARTVLYTAAGAAEGIIEPGGLKVAPLATPGTSVRVMPGGALVLNRYPGGALETYAVTQKTQQAVAVAATGSSGRRSDLVIVRLTDPDHASGTPGARFEIIQGVPADADASYAHTLGYPALALARIDLPASTGTVTAGMITDLRSIANPKQLDLQLIYDPPNERFLLNGRTDWQPWPVLSGGTGTYGHVDVPAWATHVQITSLYTSVGARGNTYGRARTLLGYGEDLTAEGVYDTTTLPTSDPYQIAINCAAELAVPASLRGTRQPVRTEGRLGATNIPRERGPWTGGATRIVTRLTFLERAV